MTWFRTTSVRSFGESSAVSGVWTGVLCVGGALLMLLTAGTAQATALVTDVSFAARSDGQGYVMRLRMTDRPEAYMLDRIDAHTLKWVVYDTRLDETYEEVAPRGAVKQYTTTQKAGHLVVRIELKTRYSVSATTYRDGASDDLLLNLAYEDAPLATAEASSASAASSASSTSSSASASGTPSPGSSATEGAANSGETDGVGGRVTRERSRLDTVVIDPGHGGKDPGAMANGLQEKDLVLEVAHQLGEYIENRLDIEVVFTRTDDRFIALEERGHMANRKGGDLFISLHANAFRSSSVNGTETYFLGRSKTDAARRVMRQENSVVREYENNPDRYEEYDAEAFVKSELFLSANMRFSEEFAALVQEQFKERVQRRSRGVHQAGFYVLWSASMPSVLVELGYLTNPQEARFLNSDRGQVYLASAIFRAVRTYKNDYNKGIVSSE